MSLQNNAEDIFMIIVLTVRKATARCVIIRLIVSLVRLNEQIAAQTSLELCRYVIETDNWRDLFLPYSKVEKESSYKTQTYTNFV